VLDQYCSILARGEVLLFGFVYCRKVDNSPEVSRRNGSAHLPKLEGKETS